MRTEIAYDLAVRVAPPDDRARFEKLLDRHHRRMRRFAAGIVADRERVDDGLQEAYLKAYRKLPSYFANEAHEAAWLYRVIYRCCLDELRRACRPVPPDLGRAIDDVDRRLSLDRALRGLRPSDRAVIYLVGVLGLEQEHAATVLGIPRGTLSWRLSVARRRFRGLLDNEGIGDA
jgi:RNA polymerase sigma-70 factor (ECF subfamily)